MPDTQAQKYNNIQELAEMPSHPDFAKNIFKAIGRKNAGPTSAKTYKKVISGRDDNPAKQFFKRTRFEKVEEEAEEVEETATAQNQPPIQTETAPKVSDGAKSILEEAGIDPSTIKGSGKDGLVTKSDAEKAVKAKIKIDAEAAKNAKTETPPKK